MIYYSIGQDKKTNGKRTGMNSVEDRDLISIDIPKLVPVKVYDTQRKTVTVLPPSYPKYDDIISGPIGLYSNRICNILKELESPILIKPVKLLMVDINENDSEELGYNFVLRVPDVECMKDGH